jgi:outer membrane immunogenic protein
MSRLIACGLAAAFLLAVPQAATAADEKLVVVSKRPAAKPRKARMYQPPPVHKAMPAEPVGPAWTGFYAGASFASRWSAADWNTSSILPPPVGTTPATAPFDEQMLRAGGYLGYNWQTGRFAVIGIEADLGWADKTKTIGGIPGTYTAAGAAAAIANDSASVGLGWDASVRGRLGLLVAPAWLVYGTVGVAWQHIEFGASCALAGGYCAAARAQTHDATRVGWTASVGVEGSLAGNWLARVEYRYADFDNVAHTFFSSTGDDIFMDVKVRTHTALFGLAYKFGWHTEAWPLTARH